MPAHQRLFFIILTSLNSLILPPTTLAGSDPITNEATVSASVLEAPPSYINQPPSIPILLRPFDGTVTRDDRPEFAWRQSSDPDGNTVYYDLYLDGVPIFLGIANSGSSGGTGYTAYIDGGEVRLLPSSALPEGPHDWFVRAYDINLESSSSASWHFEIDLTPPFILVTDIDTHHNLNLDSRDSDSITADTSFEVRGPKDIYFTIYTEPFAKIELNIYDARGTLHTSAAATDSGGGIVYPAVYLNGGTYTVETIAIDRVGYTTVLPNFTLFVTVSKITLPHISPLPIPPELIIPPIPVFPPGYTATVQKITTRFGLPILISAALAIALLILLILLKKRRYNLVLIQPNGHPLEKADVFHSKPDTKWSSTPVLLMRRDPVKHALLKEDNGKLYIPRLTRYSTLTIRTSTTLLIVSLNRFKAPLTLVVS